MDKEIQDLYQTLYDNAACAYVYAVKHDLPTDMWETMMADLDWMLSETGEN